MLQWMFMIWMWCACGGAWINYNGERLIASNSMRKIFSRIRMSDYKGRGRKATPIEYDEPDFVINDDITHDEVRLFVQSEETGEEVMIGIYPIDAARCEAERLEKDLVLVNDKSDPPICKIVEFSKYRYEVNKKIKEDSKREREIKKHQNAKELRMSYKIDQHDLEVKLNSVQRFIENGDKVRVSVTFKGREHSFHDLGIALLNKMIDKLKETMKDAFSVDALPRREGAGVSMIVGPKKTK